MSPRVLVTGGAGFIGANLIRRLLQDGNRVICIDNLSSGSFSNIKDLLARERFEFIEGDVTDKRVFEDVGDVDQIYNLACPASPPFYQDDPVSTIKTCFVGALNALDYARACNVRILQTSTSEVYGDPLEHPQKESYRGNVNPIGSRACYDEGKRAAEALFFDYARQYGVDIRVVRIFNTYGPWMRSDDGRVVTNFIMQVLRGDDITVYGDGSQTRSFCFVDDLVEGLLAMMAAEGFAGPVNLGNPEERSMLELIEVIKDLTGSTSRIVFCDLPQDDPKRRCPCIDLARERLGWEPTTNLREGLSQTIDYLTQHALLQKAR